MQYLSNKAQAPVLGCHSGNVEGRVAHGLNQHRASFGYDHGIARRQDVILVIAALGDPQYPGVAGQDSATPDLGHALQSAARHVNLGWQVPIPLHVFLLSFE